MASGVTQGVTIDHTHTLTVMSGVTQGVTMDHTQTDSDMAAAEVEHTRFYDIFRSSLIRCFLFLSVSHLPGVVNFQSTMEFLSTRV